MIEGHSNALVYLLVGSTVMIGLFGYVHARRFWEGLPPLLDACVSAAGFLAVIGAFIFGGRIGSVFGHPHAGRVLAVAVTMILYRILRTWLGKEQERYRKIKSRPTLPPDP